MKTPENNQAASAAPAAAPASGAPAPVSGAPSTPAPAVPVAAKPDADKALPGSPESAKKRLNKAAKADLEGKANTPAAPDKKDAATPDAPPAGEPAPEGDAPAGEPAPGHSDLFSQVDAAAKDGKPLKYSVDGEEHEIKSAQHLRTLLAQAHKHGPTSRELAGLKKHVAENYGPFDAAMKSRPGLKQAFGVLVNQPELDATVMAILSGEAPPEVAEMIRNGQPLINPDRIEANVLKRQAQGTSEAKAQAARIAETDKQLGAISQKYGEKWVDESGAVTRESKALYDELKQMVADGEAGNLLAAYELRLLRTGELEKRIKEKAETEKADAIAAAAQERTKKQAAIIAASGVAGGGTNPQPITKEKGSPEDARARLRAANARKYG
jgi:hypothetical protein